MKPYLRGGWSVHLRKAIGESRLRYGQDGSVAVKTDENIIGYDFPFWVDANASYDLEQHASTLKEFHRFRCLF